ncbi:hypothetical protein B296_00034511 [Ensete ventricosum]|uniref:Uncharacterized protein n=1 Tax=Ensete ventricosum TaxID=4639 RepID=A0A426Y023_ENSVE|nr:hypothetical protein B296_00034511 [Ensete ventricosum]
MPMNIKEGDRYVINHGEDSTTVDFGGYVSLGEKDAGMVGRGDPAWDRHNKMDGAEAVTRQRAREEEEAAVRQPAGSGCGSSRRALLGGEGAVGQRSDPVTIEYRGGARRLCCSSTAIGDASLL